MSAYNLAVIFSQCLMLPPEGTSSLDSLADLPKQRMCGNLRNQRFIEETSFFAGPLSV
eukprot:m.47918 g.47918  ORF g.47918 m.47918 type:complete len:58 (+) comp33841_c0_seq5:5152-5325(+)